MESPALVIIGNSTQGLGIIRSASSLGVKTFMINDKFFCSSKSSKFISNYKKLKKGTIHSLANSTSSSKLTETLLNLPASFPSTLLGINEDIINYIHVNSPDLSLKYNIPTNNYSRIFDKYRFNELLPKQNQIETRLIRDVNISTLNGEKYLIKSRIGNKFRNKYDRKAVFIKDINHGMKEDIANHFSNDELIVQELIDSEESVLSCCGFTVNGEVKGLFQYAKVRQHPDRFGTGTYLKSIFNGEIFEIAKLIWGNLNYTGISEIEFILDKNDKHYKVVEMNPRTWKSIDFATKCGQNLVEKFILYNQGKPYDSTLNFEKGKFWVDIFTDIIQMARERKIFRYDLGNMHECTWDRHDPMPFLTSIIFSPFVLLKI